MSAHKVNPILNVSDFASSVEWFEKLGWRKLWDWGDPATFGAVKGFAGGRPKVEEIMAYFPALIPKSLIETKVEIVEA